MRFVGLWRISSTEHGRLLGSQSQLPHSSVRIIRRHHARTLRLPPSLEEQNPSCRLFVIGLSVYPAHQFAATYTKATCLFIVFSCPKETIQPNPDKLRSESNPKGTDRIRNFKSQNSSVIWNVTEQTKDCESMRFVVYGNSITMRGIIPDKGESERTFRYWHSTIYFPGAEQLIVA